MRMRVRVLHGSVSAPDTAPGAPRRARRAVRTGACVHSANHQTPATTQAHSNPAGTALGHGACSARCSTEASTTQPMSRTVTTRTRLCLNMHVRYPVGKRSRDIPPGDSPGGLTYRG
ncbi:hypothetical protein GA0115239_104531 [Streptomyces sp. BpilaLS-43]|nr:hypothetical protein GA0115239_104531 [Streptomyces sp. BpilaLS-43]